MNKFTESAMEYINRNTDDLHRTFHPEFVEGEKKTYTLLQFQPYFIVEKLLGVPRHVQVGGQLRGPRWYQRLYSIFISIATVFVSFQMNLRNSDFEVDYAFRIFLVLLNQSIYILLTARNCFCGPKTDSFHLFLKLCDLDKHLEILGHKTLHRKQYRREVFILFLVLFMNAIMLIWTATVSGYDMTIFILWFPYTFMETQEILSMTIVTALKYRMQYLTRVSEMSYLKWRSKKHFYFEECDVHEFNFEKISSIFEKMMNVHKDIEHQFRLHVLIHMLSISATSLILLWELLLRINREKATFAIYSSYLIYFVFSFIRILIFCKVFESFKVAVEEFRVHLFEVVRVKHPAWSPEARALLSYSERCNSDFSVYGMFNVDIFLPFSFSAAMLSLYIAIVQLVLI